MIAITEKQAALEAVKEDGMNLRLVSEDLQNDKDVVLVAMANNTNAFQFASQKLQMDEELASQVEKNDSYYYNMLDPRTGLRYDIPLLSPIDPKYYWEYIYRMKLKERAPNTFEKMLRWD
ncbi:DUF4116 domain-containing protein [Pseudodesulfovibrio piezophilus]|uniref:DUF4116 domain-containing protein n=1 Tax=Pseudodesulfovibrio piezophilus (strain DSM 21447 / JCM 15486 / C1TLV30) TaxID=1322246 RepID=M1WU06_PSEP2|nr:DUF4116 domain-containing protein [Pseudodesulfovibrio piezophilus]CCH50072.1 protein of unknown function [Pseudodesulfovibrio piezophilus C1TLV30]